MIQLVMVFVFTIVIGNIGTHKHLDITMGSGEFGNQK